MANYFYDEDTDTVYVSEGDGFGWLGLLFVLATPFFIIAVWLRQYASFASEHALLSWGVFLSLSTALGALLYKKRNATHRILGIVAVVVTLLPVALAQAFYAIPYILSHNGAIGVTFEWSIVTFFTVGISFFVTQISLLFKNGVKHLIIATVYLLIALIIIF